MAGRLASTFRTFTQQLGASLMQNSLVVWASLVVLAGSILLVWKAASVSGGPAWHEVAILILFFLLAVSVIPAALVGLVAKRYKLRDPELVTAMTGIGAMVVSAVTGLGVLFGLFLTAEGLANIEISRENLVASQYNQALENLSNPDREHDAVLSLGRIASQSQDFHWRAMNALAGFVRRHATRNEGATPAPRSLKITPTVQEALSIIGGRRWQWDEGPPLDLRDTDLRGADFSGSHLGNIDLTAADLAEANFSAADLRGATLDGTNLSGAGLLAAQLGGSILVDVTLTDAILLGARLERTNLSRTKGLTQAQLDLACADDQTVLPSGPDGTPLRANLANLELPYCME